MKQQFTMMPLSLALVLLILEGCGDQKKTQNESEAATEVVGAMVFPEPDNYFEAAIVLFNDGDKEASANQIANAIAFIESVVVDNDTANSPIIEYAVNDLYELSEGIQVGEVTSPDQLRDVFASADKSIGMYHLMVIERWVINATDDEKSVNRMKRAIIRTEYALKHASIELSDDEKLDLETAKKDVAEAEKPSPALWQKVKSKVLQLNERINA